MLLIESTFLQTILYIISQKYSSNRPTDSKVSNSYLSVFLKSSFQTFRRIIFAGSDNRCIFLQSYLFKVMLH